MVSRRVLAVVLAAFLTTFSPLMSDCSLPGRGFILTYYSSQAIPEETLPVVPSQETPVQESIDDPLQRALLQFASGTDYPVAAASVLANENQEPNTHPRACANAFYSSLKVEPYFGVPSSNYSIKNPKTLF